MTSIISRSPAFGRRILFAFGTLLAISACSGDSSITANTNRQRTDARLPTHAELQAALEFARNTSNGGFNLDMWATVVDRGGVVVAVAYTGAKEGDQWQGS